MSHLLRRNYLLSIHSMIWSGSALDLSSPVWYSQASSGFAVFTRCYCCWYCLSIRWGLHSSYFM